jgi:hypothetical protein
MSENNNRTTIELNPMDIFNEPTVVMDSHLQEELKRISSYPSVDHETMMTLEKYIEAIMIRVIEDVEE